MRLSDKIAIVTGGGGEGGIGAAIVERFIQEGATVVVADIDLKKAEGVARPLGERAIPWQCDVTSSDAVNKLVSETVSRSGRLDVFVNNVGFTLPGRIVELSDAVWDTVIAGNLTSTFYGVRAALQQMRRQKSGSIINIASAAGIGGAPGLGVYGAAKAGVINLTQSAAVENFKAGVRVNAILPNAATKPLLEWFESTPDGRDTKAAIENYARCGAPHEIAAAALFLASADSSYVNGAVLPVDGGLSARVGCVDAKID